MTGETKRLCVATNEDGFGPSAFAYYVVQAILRGFREREPNVDLLIRVLNASKLSYNQSLYAGDPEVCPKPVHSLITFEKDDSGQVAVRPTLDKLESYKQRRRSYFQEVEPHLAGCNVVLDIGVPLFALSAKNHRVEHRVTLFDHSWAATLRGVCSEEAAECYDEKPTDDDRRRADEIASWIEEDERCATEVWLFDSPVTPREFFEHWERQHVPLQTLDGVLGRESDREGALAVLNMMLTQQLGQQPVSRDDELVLISPGGTTVWKDFLPGLIHGLLKKHSADGTSYVPVISCPAGQELEDAMRQSRWLRWFEFVPGGTQQVIMPAFSLVVTRAGGGVVNDALATRTPIACIEECQWQVQLIARELRTKRFIPTSEPFSWKGFTDDPAGTIDALRSVPRPRPDLSPDAADEVARRILSLL